VTKDTLRCPDCGATTDAPCGCGKPYEYIRAGEAAAKAVEREREAAVTEGRPERSDRVLAAEVGVSQPVISAARKATDKNLSVEPRTGKDGKLRRMPTKRPAPQMDIASEAVRPLVEAGQPISRKNIAEQIGVSENAVERASYFEQGRIEGLREAAENIDATALSLTAQQKFDVVLKREMQRLASEFDQQVQAGIKQAIADTILPHYNRMLDHYNRVIKARKGVMNRATYRLILSCLHPDRLAALGKADEELRARYLRAFHEFSKLEIVLCDEKALPTNEASLPRTVEEWEKRRAEAKAVRKGHKQALHQDVALH